MFYHSFTRNYDQKLTIKIYYPFPKQQILDSSKQKEFAHDNHIFDENGRKFSYRVENTVEKGEIARYECFQKICTADT